VLVTGAGGLVGTALMRQCAAVGDQVLGHTHESLDITDIQRLKEVTSEYQPEVIINCAAWTDVDGCESNREKAEAVNAAGPENLATVTREENALLITISTDYVFDGSKDGFYTQRDDPNPQSVYGWSKLEGERRAQLASANTIIVRTGYIFGNGGRNFLSTVIERARRSEELNVITDTWGTPTYAPDLAARLRELAQLGLPGTFHVVSGGNGATFEDFTRVALKVAQCETKLVRVTSASLGRPAPRPRNSRLKCLLSEALHLHPLPTWQDRLADFVKETPVGASLSGRPC